MNDQDETERTAALLRAALSAAADVMVVREEREPQRVKPVKQFGGWLLPLAAAASVVVIALAAVIVAHLVSPTGNQLVAHPVGPAGKQGTSQTTARVPRPEVTTVGPTTAGRMTTSAPATTTPSATTTAPATSTTSEPTTSTTFVPMQTATGGEFYSPSGNIDCEIDDVQQGPYRHIGAYCQTTTPSRSVTMDATGRYTTCAGEQCLANAGDTTPTLAYGTATGVGPFRCVSAITGVTCTANGRGFLISASGITAVPA
jgi:hypothetical protein